jgi:crossover junction endodeoxyribonuclease RuvC
MTILNLPTYNLPVVGIDPSLTGTGVATPSRLLTVGSKPADLSVRGRRDRLRLAADTIILAIAEDVAPRTALIVIEAPAYSKTGHMHERSGLWWYLVDELLSDGHLVCEVTPSARAKYATGRGNAGKDEVLAAVVRRYPDQDVADNNTADALVLRAMGSRQLGRPLENGLPLAHRASLEKVLWPAAITTEKVA